MDFKKLKKLLAIILAITISVTIFAGCGKTGKDDSTDAAKTGGTDYIQNDEANLISVEKYVADYVSLPAEIAQIINLCIYENQIYFAAFVTNTGQEQAEESAEITEEDYIIKLYKLNTDGTGLEELSGYTSPEVPEGQEGIMYVETMNIDDNGNIWVTENNTSSAMGRTILLRKLDLTGSELERFDISDNNTFVYITGIQFDSSGNIYLSDISYGVYVYDNQGRLLYTLEAPNQPAYVINLIKMNDGSIAAHMSGATGYTVKLVNTDSKSWGDDISINLASGAYSGSGDYNFYYNDGTSLFGYSLEKDEGTKLLTWHDCYVNGQTLNSVEVLPDGTIFGTSYKIEDETLTAQLIIITMQTVTETANKKTLKLALFGIDPGIRTAVAEFNKENEQYKIEVTDYLQLGTADDMTSGLTKLHTEIISGNIPDIICTLGIMPLDLYIAKGMLDLI